MKIISNKEWNDLKRDLEELKERADSLNHKYLESRALQLYRAFEYTLDGMGVNMELSAEDVIEKFKAIYDFLGVEESFQNAVPAKKVLRKKKDKKYK